MIIWLLISQEASNDARKDTITIVAKKNGEIITLGAHGCYYKYAGGEGSIASYGVHAIDATGAGDAFLGALLYKVSDMRIDDILNSTSSGRYAEMGIFFAESESRPLS